LGRGNCRFGPDFSLLANQACLESIGGGGDRTRFRCIRRRGALFTATSVTVTARMAGGPAPSCWGTGGPVAGGSPRFCHRRALMPTPGKDFSRRHLDVHWPASAEGNKCRGPTWRRGGCSTCGRGRVGRLRLSFSPTMECAPRNTAMVGIVAGRPVGRTAEDSRKRRTI